MPTSWPVLEFSTVLLTSSSYISLFIFCAQYMNLPLINSLKLLLSNYSFIILCIKICAIWLRQFSKSDLHLYLTLHKKLHYPQHLVLHLESFLFVYTSFLMYFQNSLWFLLSFCSNFNTIWCIFPFLSPQLPYQIYA